MRVGVWLALVLVVPALAGCTGGSDSGDQLPPAATLPPGLAMDGAQVVTYDATRVVWQWEGAAGPAAPTPATWGEPVATTFTMPAGIQVYVDATLHWQWPDATLRVWVEGPDGSACQATAEVIGFADTARADCGLAAGPIDETETWTVAVQSINSYGDAPFTLTLEIALPSWFDDPPPAAAIHTTGARALPDSAWPGPLPAFTAHEIPAIAFEPTLGVADGGEVYYMAIVQGSARVPQVWRSVDSGASWTDVSPTIAGSPRDPDMGGDPYLHVDPVTGRAFAMDLFTPHACTLIAFSDDQGTTWTHNPVGCGSSPVDHMNIWTGPAPAGTPTVGYPRIVYLCYNDLAGGLWCTRSLNGGVSFLPATLVAVEEGGTAFANPNAPCGYSEFGHGASAPVDGTAYVPRISCERLLIYVSHDGGITWEEILVDDATGVIDDVIDEDEVAVAVDAAGNVYYMWLGPDHLPRLTISTDEGRTWSGPVVVSAPGINATRFPAITAGDEGRIAFMYYGAADPDHGRWDAYVGVSVDALAPQPVIATVPASDPADPLHVGRCLGRCNGIADFMDIQHDPTTGSVWAALVDGCTPDACSPHGPRITFGYGAAIASGQVAGPTLREQGSP